MHCTINFYKSNNDDIPICQQLYVNNYNTNSTIVTIISTNAQKRHPKQKWRTIPLLSKNQWTFIYFSTPYVMSNPLDRRLWPSNWALLVSNVSHKRCHQRWTTINWQNNDIKFYLLFERSTKISSFPDR